MLTLVDLRLLRPRLTYSTLMIICLLLIVVAARGREKEGNGFIRRPRKVLTIQVVSKTNACFLTSDAGAAPVDKKPWPTPWNLLLIITFIFVCCSFSYPTFSLSHSLQPFEDVGHTLPPDRESCHALR